MNDFINTFEDDTEVDLQKDMFLSFLLDDRHFAFSIKQVEEIIEVIPATKIPEYPDYVKGIINTKGRVVPVIDLRMRFLIEEKEYDEKTCIIILNINGIVVGFIVDTVLSVLEIPQDQIDPPPAISVDSVSKYITGIAKVDETLVILLDSSKIIEQGTLKLISSN